MTLSEEIAKILEVSTPTENKPSLCLIEADKAGRLDVKGIIRVLGAVADRVAEGETKE